MTDASPMRTAQLVETLGSGGAEVLAVEIANELAQRGHESHLIVLRGGGPFSSRVLPAVHQVDLGASEPTGGQVARILQFLNTAWVLRRQLRQRGIRVVQTHLPKANFLGVVMSVTHTSRVFATVHNNREFDYGDRAGNVKRALRRWGYCQMLKKCRGVIAVSNQVRISLGEQLGLSEAQSGRISVVENGIRPAPRLRDEERERLRAGWVRTPDEVLIVAVGRLTPQKDFPTLLEALSLVKPERPSWRCIIAGDGEAREDLLSLRARLGLDERVDLPGFVPEVGRLLGAADIFCLSSRYEGLPLALLEAMSAGLPVAAFAIDGVREVVEDGQHGLLAAPGSREGLASALAELIGDAGARARMGSRACDHVARNFGFSSMVDRLERIYRT